MNWLQRWAERQMHRQKVSAYHVALYQRFGARYTVQVVDWGRLRN